MSGTRFEVQSAQHTGSNSGHQETDMTRRRRLRWLAALSVGILIAALACYPRAHVAPASATALEPIYFAAGATAILPRERTILDTHVIWLGRAGNRLLLIEGHTDEPGGRGLSAEVARDRARSAHAYLVSRGVNTDRLQVLSRGGERPTCTERTAACRASNRRVTFSPKAP
jgi:outer membrane protein OmpA-like peptidoglycan-associated protein